MALSPINSEAANSSIVIEEQNTSRKSNLQKKANIAKAKMIKSMTVTNLGRPRGHPSENAK